MTEEEHIARAMLLGMLYRPARGWYSNVMKVPIHKIVRVDAVTLEVITDEEMIKRAMNVRGTWYPHD